MTAASPGIRLTVALLGCVTVLWVPLRAQDATLAGIITDSVTGAVVQGARVDVIARERAVARAVTDIHGAFTLTFGAGTYTVVVARLDYRPVRLDGITIAAGSTRRLTVRLVPQAYVINPVVVSASRAEEKALDAPASVTVVDERSIAERPGLTPIDHVYGTPGVDVATTGILAHEVVSRGFNNVSSGALLVLTDGRYASVPSLRINVFSFIPLTDDDIERIEMVRGPGSALYGPNSSNGVLHVLSRSPFASRPATLTLTGGERGMLHGQLRVAQSLSRRVALKLSAQYLRARDWPYVDPDEQSARLLAIGTGADPDTLLIGKRDTTVERVGGEARIDWRPGTETTVTAAVGINGALRHIELTPLGAAQLDDWRSAYGQIRVRHGRLFGQAFINTSGSGDTYLLRTGVPITDQSRMIVAQLQHGSVVGSRLNLTYGLDLQRTEPRTEGTITGRNEDDDTIDEAGGYLHADVQLTPMLRAVAAARVDYHNRLTDLVFSPRAALVLQPKESHTFRLTYNRAFSTPNTNNLFLDLIAGVLPTPVPIPVRLVGVPKDGFSFRRDCDGGLCMRSPYTPGALGGDTAYLPLDVTLLWPMLVDSLRNRGIDLSAVTPPTGADVATALGRLDIGTGTFGPVTDARDIPPLRPTIDNVIELGYRGVLGDRVSLGVDVYKAWKNDFQGAERVETPNAFFDPVSLAAYLANFMSADSAQFIAGLVGQVPAGTVTPVEARDPWDVLVSYRNFGEASYWGADLDVGAILTPTIAVQGTYSWTSKDMFALADPAGQVDSLPLNAPANRASGTVLFRHDGWGVNAQVRFRWVDGFPVRSGVYVGDVSGYAVVDALVGYRLPFAPTVTVTMNALNLTDNAHREFVGAPRIGRLVTGSVRAEF